MQSSSNQEFIQQYEDLCATREKMDKELESFKEKTLILDQSIVNDFEVLSKTQDELTQSSLSSSPFENSKQELERVLVPLCSQLEAQIQVLKIPCKNKREKILLENIKKAFQQTRANVVLKNLQ